MKKLLFVLLVVTLFFIAGCDLQSTEEIENAPTTCPRDCDTGKEGITTKVYYPLKDDVVKGRFGFSPFILVSNEGESNSNVDVLVAGLDENLFSDYYGCSHVKDIELVVDDPDFDRFVDINDLPTASVSLDKETVSQTMTTYIRYDYTTFGIFDVFIDGNERGSTEDVSVVSSSGPVKVTSISQQVFAPGETINLFFDIEAELDANGNERIIPIRDVLNGQCKTSKEDIVDVEVSVAIFNKKYRCEVMKFDKGKGVASSTCDISTLGESGQPLTKDYLGEDGLDIEAWVELDYAIEEVQSVIFEVTA
jgi:hypothetical protein